MRAERRLGELLMEREPKPGPRGNGDTLSLILGAKTEQQARPWSSRWQRIAGIPAADFEAHIGTTAGTLSPWRYPQDRTSGPPGP